MAITFDDLMSRVNDLYKDEKSPDLQMVKDLLLSYSSNPKDWKQYVTWNDSRYTRTIVDKGNGRYNLLILCWGPGQGSPIHDHSNSDCFVKILRGQLKETLFKLPQESECCGEEGHEMEQVGESMVFNKDQVTYIHDNKGVAHRMENPSHTEGCVTLHLYTPPYTTCHKFDDRTSKPVKVTMSWDQDFSAKAPSCQGIQKAGQGSCCALK